jgi:hypothetical protein
MMLMLGSIIAHARAVEDEESGDGESWVSWVEHENTEFPLMDSHARSQQ